MAIQCSSFSFLPQDWHKFQIAAMGLMSIRPSVLDWILLGLGLHGALNSTIWTVLSLERSQCTCTSWHSCMKNTWSFHCMSTSGSMPLILLITDVTLQLLDLFAVLRFWTTPNYDCDWIHLHGLASVQNWIFTLQTFSGMYAISPPGSHILLLSCICTTIVLF